MGVVRVAGGGGGLQEGSRGGGGKSNCVFENKKPFRLAGTCFEKLFFKATRQAPRLFQSGVERWLFSNCIANNRKEKYKADPAPWHP